MTGITWLASYPKSGNTWVRIFLSNYLCAKTTPVDINDLDGNIASSRYWFDEAVGVDSANLTREEIGESRCDMYRLLAGESQPPLFVKVHDAWAKNRRGVPVFPQDVTAGVVYIIRHPFDVAVSFAHHLGVSVDEAVGRMCSADCGLATGKMRLHEQLPQSLLSWSGHVRSWVGESGLPVHVVRYEDLSADPETSFAGILKAAGLDIAARRLHQAIAASRFNRVQAQEQAHGFRERAARASAFFRSGRVGSWHDELTSAHVRRLMDAHGDTMCRFGYGDDGAQSILRRAV